MINDMNEDVRNRENGRNKSTLVTSSCTLPSLYAQSPRSSWGRGETHFNSIFPILPLKILHRP